MCGVCVKWGDGDMWRVMVCNVCVERGGVYREG